VSVAVLISIFISISIVLVIVVVIVVVIVIAVVIGTIIVTRKHYANLPVANRVATGQKAKAVAKRETKMRREVEMEMKTIASMRPRSYNDVARPGVCDRMRPHVTACGGMRRFR